MSVWTIVVAAGSGTRFGGSKQLEEIGGRRVLDWSVDQARHNSDGVVLVLGPDSLEAGATSPVDAVAVGGSTRAESVRAGLAHVPNDAEIILVHDAARPLATTDIYKAVIDAVGAGADAAVPAIPVVDTIKRVDEAGTVVATVDRQDLVAVQTPQGFRADALRRAHESRPEATDDAGSVEAMGGRVVAVSGDQRNLKITVPHDLVVARALMQA